MASSFNLLATVIMLLAFTASARPLSWDESEYSSAAADFDAALTAKTPDIAAVDGVVIPETATTDTVCHARDINILQYEANGEGLPSWSVQILNLCTNPMCNISEVIVQCGAFHSPQFVNPHVFRRLDVQAGTCLVNDGKRLDNADFVSFEYREIFKQQLTLRSAKVTCW